MSAIIVTKNNNTNKNNKPKKHPSSWEPIDDLLLRHLKEIKKMGWKEISQYFENRTPNACQFRWRRLKSGNLKSNKTAFIDVTEFPGEIKILNPSPSIVNERKLKNKTKNKQNNVIEFPLPSNSQTFPTSSSSSNDSNTISLSSLNSSIDNISTSKKNHIPISSLIENNDRQKISTSSFHNNNNNNNNQTFNTKNQTIQGNIPSGSIVPPINSDSQEKQPASTINTMTKGMKSNNNKPYNNKETAKKFFIKPRSYSHSVTSNSMMFPKESINSPEFINSDNDTEKLGFIPKVFVRSRRGSSIIIPSSPTLSFSFSSPSSSNTTSNATLATSKSRKNSLVRRHSLITPISTVSSRRASMVAAPNSLSINFNNYQLPTLKQRRESIISKSQKTMPFKTTAKYWEQPMKTTNHFFDHNYSFPDIPTNLEKHRRRQFSVPWSSQEDQLLLENQTRKLSLSELSILLPNRSESDIDIRLHSLTEKLKNCNSNINSSSSAVLTTTSSSYSNSSKLSTPKQELTDCASPMHSPKLSYNLNQTGLSIDSQEFKDHLDLDTQRANTSHFNTSSSKEVSPSIFSQVSTDDSVSSTSSITNANIVLSDYPTFLKTTGQEHSAIVYQNFLGYQQQMLQEKQQQIILPSINSIFQRF